MARSVCLCDPRLEVEGTLIALHSHHIKFLILPAKYTQFAQENPICLRPLVAQGNHDFIIRIANLSEFMSRSIYLHEVFKSSLQPRPILQIANEVEMETLLRNLLIKLTYTNVAGDEWLNAW